jgi:hypothetical protein
MPQPRSITLITSYSRPQYLKLCLEYLSQAVGIENQEIWLFVDRGRSLVREFYEVLADFKHLSIRTTFRPEHNYHGNSYNTLEAYKEAYATDAKFIYLVEDDVLVRPDFFKWHEAIQEKVNPFVSVAYRCSRNSEVRTDIVDPEAYLTSSKDFASIGCCWRREQLAPVIQHAKIEYYSDLAGYLAKHFPNNRFAGSFWEQDGMVMRLLGNNNDYIVAFGYVPRSFHFGNFGYNRPRGSRLSYDELKGIIHDLEKIKEADRDFGDIEPMPRDNPAEWDPAKLYRVQHFD